MLRIRSYLTVLMATCLLLVGGPALGAAPQGKALTPEEFEKMTEEGLPIFFEKLRCLTDNLIDCLDVEEAREWAVQVTEWKYPGGNRTDGTRANAFKHCIWMGATATRLGESEAKKIGGTHEFYGINQPGSLRKMDGENNAVGAALGAKAKEDNLSDQWGYVIEECKKLADSNQLYGLDGIKGNYAQEGD